jgi:hypothetical protein
VKKRPFKNDDITNSRCKNGFTDLEDYAKTRRQNGQWLSFPL